MFSVTRFIPLIQGVCIQHAGSESVGGDNVPEAGHHCDTFGAASCGQCGATTAFTFRYVCREYIMNTC